MSAPNDNNLPNLPQDQETNGAAPSPSGNTPTSPNRGTNPSRRALTSLSIFIPLSRQPGENGQDNGERVGLTWTLEVFANDGDDLMGEGQGTEGGQQGSADDTTGQPAGPPGSTPGSAEGTAAEGDAAGDEGRRPGTEPHSLVFIVGPDGRFIPRPGANEDGTVPAPFFAFPWNLFSSAPPPPDPAKAAELLASLPTVGRALLRRVDKVFAAEDLINGSEDEERGWKCGICLEGLAAPPPNFTDDGSTAPEAPLTVKALPCNHLFHEGCLHPWFTSHHTCPTCRLDLDPLRTLHGPRETRANPLRPAATGSGRATPTAHPYGRDRRPGTRTPVTATFGPSEAGPVRSRTSSTATSNTSSTASTNTNPPPNPLPNLEAPIPSRLPFANFFDHVFTASPIPMDRELERDRASTPAPPEVRTPAAEASTLQEGSRASPVVATAPAPSGTTPSVLPAPSNDDPTDASRPEAPTDPATAHPSEEQVTAASPRPQPPTRRPHMTFINIAVPGLQNGLNVPLFPFGPRLQDQTSDRPAGTNPAGQNSDTPQAPATTNAEANPSTGNEPAGQPRQARQGGQADTNENENEQHRETRIPFPFDLLFMPPFGRAPGGDETAGEPERPAGPEPSASQTAASSFVPQSLESWTVEREKGLGWRCDAVECLIAPPVPDNDTDDEEMESSDDVGCSGTTADLDRDLADKEMVSIYAPAQPLFPPRRPGDMSPPHEQSQFVLLACPHRWHRSCIETAERSAGHMAVPDDNGRQWVRCQKCRKEGWIVPRPSEPATVSTAHLMEVDV